ncbi:MAG: cytochrome P450 [Myxococcales bacterium]|nr:cytochrome P450 [Myxococcales bacterium]
MGRFDSVDFFSDTSLVNHPYDYFEWLRERGPVVLLDQYPVAAVVGYDEALAVYRGDEDFSAVNAATGPFDLPFEVGSAPDITPQIEEYRSSVPYGALLVTQDPPSHAKSRGLLMGMITPRRLRENEEFMWTLADRQIDEFVERGRFEAIGDYAQPYATLVIADLLGVPDSDRDGFRQLLGPVPGQLDRSKQGGNNPLEQIGVYFFNYLTDRRANPQKDVLTQLAQARYPDGSEPSVVDVVTIAAFLFGAGQDTTVRLLAAALRFLAEDPELQRKVRKDRALIPGLVEEVLRLEGPVKSDYRLARRPVTIGGVEVPAGTTVMQLLHAINRDPRRFERPNEFILGRKNVKEHLAFGRGIHACVGAPLARAEAKVSLERLFDRTEDIRLDERKHGPPQERRFEYEPSFIMRGLKELHLEITPAR